MQKPLVLLANDDGYRARGLRLLREALAPRAEVIVCAPEVEQSAASHALSLHRPLRLFEHEPGIFSVDGTPADCVYVALHAERRVLPRRPDVLVSGVNHGVNLGDDVFYSGTVAAAREGALKGIPSLAVSAGRDADLEAAATLAARLTLALAALGPATVLLNVNVPQGRDWPLRATRLGRRIYRDEVEFRHDPRGREYLWIGGPGADHQPSPGSDTDAFDAGAVGITPLVLDLADQQGAGIAEALAAALRDGH
ncbi:MAG TPA: 5'/3'-nucleotidase SurE [Polyangiaceae bacterium]|nr:5'/3'-nucleotidase SurE [Polyangiaceae bacterium]